MLKEQLVKVFSLMKVTLEITKTLMPRWLVCQVDPVSSKVYFWGDQPGFLFQYEPELDAFLEFLIWRFSIWVDKPTPGNALMNLRYRDERAVPAGGKEGKYNRISEFHKSIKNKK